MTANYIFILNIELFNQWCKDNFLSLNISKTKEMIIDFRRKKENLEPVIINGQEVEVVEEYKYLGTIIDDKLSWKSNTHRVHAKAQQRLFFLRKLRSFNVDTCLLKLFYQTFINSILTFSFHAWYGNLPLSQKN